MAVDKEETDIGVHALLIAPDGEILLQQRDDNPDIVNPGLISMFGGTIHKDEEQKEGLARELFEELELDIKDMPIEKLGVFYKTKEIDGVDFEVNVFVIRNVEFSKLKLKEGKSIFKAKLKDCLKSKKLTRMTRLALENLRKINN